MSGNDAEAVASCTHETLYFGSGDYYVFCKKCGGRWGRLELTGVRKEYGVDKDGIEIGCDPSAANLGPTFSNSDERVNAQAAIAALNVPALVQKLADMTDDYFRVHKDSVDRMEKIIALEARIRELEGALKEERKWHDDNSEAYIEGAQQAVAEGNKADEMRMMRMANKHDKRTNIITAVLRTASALGDQHE